MRTKKRLKKLLRRYRKFNLKWRRKYKSINNQYTAIKKQLNFIKKSTNHTHINQIKIRLSNSQKQAHNLIAQRHNIEQKQAQTQAEIKTNKLNCSHLLKYVPKLLKHYKTHHSSISTSYLRHIKQRLIINKHITNQLNQLNDRLASNDDELRDKIKTIQEHHVMVTHNLQIIIKNRGNVIKVLTNEKSNLESQYQKFIKRMNQKLNLIKAQFRKIKNDFQSEQVINRRLKLLINNKNASLNNLHKELSASNLKIHNLILSLNLKDAHNQDIYNQLTTLKDSYNQKLNRIQERVYNLQNKIRYQQYNQIKLNGILSHEA